jgi:selT/selW/selH-like putative selenoprotein
LADELQAAFGVKASVVAGATGAFEVLVDGKPIFSKLQGGRFPDPGEIVAKIKAGK